MRGPLPADQYNVARATLAKSPFQVLESAPGPSLKKFPCIPDDGAMTRRNPVPAFGGKSRRWQGWLAGNLSAPLPSPSLLPR